ncbi:hypothetical protein [Iamia sp.]|uniref:hypothetical protein n=1 Tax=Iamia sp. TaxID=2722710 RepID=UPI002BAA02E4|nr:hypothetical protein [Iamia sp.]HXH59351.1 hypothetical protein [Iamia sp.]
MLALIDTLADRVDLDFLHTAVGPVIGGAIAAAGARDVTAAFESFMEVICGPDHRRVLAEALGPGGPARAERESRFFFTDEIIAMAQWNFDANVASHDRGTDPAGTGRRQPATGPPPRRPDRRPAPVRRDRHRRRRRPPPPLRSPSALAHLVAEFVTGVAARSTPTSAQQSYPSGHHPRDAAT